MFDVTCMDKYGNTVTNLTQWDSNQTLYIEDHGFTIAPFFHFCNKNSEKALVVASTIGTDGVMTVAIPNSLLTEPYNITAYVYLTEDKSSKTVEVIQLPVRPRPIPDSYEYVDDPVIVDLNILVAEIKALTSEIALAENDRITAETIRINNENQRIENENVRISAENDRVVAETTRDESETTRLENEALRVDAELERVSAEDTRKANEEIRLSNESDRITAETSRTDAETLRDSAEEIRELNENARIEAENARNDAEEIRESNEETRQSQEEERQTNTATAIENAEKATDRANIAAEACEGIVAGTGFIPVTEKGISGGIATLDDTGKVPLEQLPDDIGGDTVPDGCVYINFDESEETGELIPIDADTLGGYGVEHFATLDDTGKIALEQIPDGISGDIPDNVLFATEITATDIDTPKLNADTLEGHSADYFATAEAIGKVDGQAILNEPILEKALSITVDGDYNFKLGGSNYKGNDLPNLNYGYAQATIKVRGGIATHTNTTVILWGSETANARHIATNYYNGTAWSGWQIEFTTAGGTITTDSSARLPQLPLVLVNGVNENGSVVRYDDKKGALGHLGFVEKNVPIFSDVNGAVKELLHTGNMASHVLPLTGGILTGDNVIVDLRNSDNTFSAALSMSYANNLAGIFGGVMGSRKWLLNINANNEVSIDGIKTAKLHHTGNKPTGTYTGNGSATKRIVQTGGIGGVICIYTDANTSFAISSIAGTLYCSTDGTITFDRQSWFTNDGKFNIATDNKAVNASGVTYTYERL